MELNIGEFNFASRNSSEFGIYVDDVIPFTPPKRLRRINIPGKSGSYDYGSKDYDDIGISLNCYCKIEYDRASFREVTYWLSRKARLYIWDDPDKYYVAELQDADQLDWKNLSHMNPFQLNFICEPFAYKDVPAVAVEHGINGISYQGTHEAPFVLRLENISGTEISNIVITTISEERSI